MSRHICVRSLLLACLLQTDPSWPTVLAVLTLGEPLTECTIVKTGLVGIPLDILVRSASWFMTVSGASWRRRRVLWKTQILLQRLAFEMPLPMQKGRRLLRGFPSPIRSAAGTRTYRTRARGTSHRFQWLSSYPEQLVCAITPRSSTAQGIVTDMLSSFS